MRILAIRGEHLASLHDAFELDFRSAPLAGAGLFAIVGSTGAGKSTLLDAACLALYGQTPRTRGSGGVRVGREADAERLASKDPRSLLSRGCRAGFAEVDFRAQDGQEYRARWRVRQPPRRQTLGDAEMSLLRIEDGRVIADRLEATRKAVEGLVGFTFEEFQKAVLLPQGEFAEFLKADGGKRAEILEKVAGGRLYSRIGELVGRRRSAAASELQAIEGAVSARRVLDDAEREALVAEREGAALEAKRRHALVEEADRALQWHRKHGELREAAAGAAGALAAAERALVEAEPRRLEAEAVAAALTGKGALEAAMKSEATRDVAERREKELGAALATARARWSDAQAAATSAEQARAAVEDEERRSAPLLEEARALDGRVEEAGRLVRQQTEALETAAREARTAEAEAKRLAGEAAGYRDELERAERWLAEHAAEAPVADEWSRWKDVVQRHSAATSGAARAGERLRGAPTPAAVATARGAAADARAEADAAARRRSDAEEVAAAAAAAEGEARARDDAAKGLLERARAAQSLESRRAELVDGEPCPLCGSQQHPWAKEGRVHHLVREAVAHAGETGRELLAAAAVRERAAKTLAKAGEVASAAEATARSKADAATQLEEALATAGREAIEAELRRHEQDRDECEAALAVPFAPFAGWREALRSGHASFVQRWGAVTAAHSAQRERIAADQKALAACEPALATARAIAAERRRALDDRERLRVEAKADAGARLQERAKLLGGRKTAEVVAELADRRQRTARLAKDRAEAAGKVGRETATLEGQHEQAGRAAEDARSAALAAAADLDAALARLGVDRRSLEARIAKGAAFVDDERAAREKLTRAADERRGQLTAREAALAAHEATGRPALDATAAEAAKTEAAKAEEDARKRHVDALAALKSDDAAREAREALGPRLAEAKARSSTWQKLYELIGQAGQSSYRTFVQGLALESLVAHANRHLEQLAPRYRLLRVPDTDMDLQVLDRDQADAVRAVNSLSGGETFLVSLALALGLSALSSRASRVESLFVDEGFGSLDPETLDQAMSVLESLQSTGRTVGIISHVPELHERVGVLVRVEKRGGGRSQVKVERVAS